MKITRKNLRLLIIFVILLVGVAVMRLFFIQVKSDLEPYMTENAEVTAYLKDFFIMNFPDVEILEIDFMDEKSKVNNRQNVIRVISEYGVKAKIQSYSFFVEWTQTDHNTNIEKIQVLRENEYIELYVDQASQ